MNLGWTVRRMGLTAVATLGTLVFAAGCSSTSNGTPSAAGALFGSSGGNGGAHASVPVATTAPSGGNGGGNGAAAGGFCGALAKGAMPNLGNMSKGSAALDQLVSRWQALDDAAPPAIKKDTDLVLKELEGFASGNPDMSSMQGYATALQHIAQYLGSHC